MPAAICKDAQCGIKPIHIGAYNPDWAFVTEREEKLYFVRETKSTLNSADRRAKENQKVACGRKHFETIGVDFDLVTSLAEVVI